MKNSKKCLICEKVFYKTSNVSKKYWKESRLYCSNHCRWIDTKDKIHLFKKGSKLSSEVLKNVTIANRLKAKKGVDHWNWKGGISQDKQHNYDLSKRWRMRNPEKQKRILQKRLAVSKAGGELTLETIQSVYEDNIRFYGTLTCIYCEQSILFGKDSLEHKMPLNRGGTNIYSNLAIACRSCNSRKGAKTVQEFMLRKDK